jgi:hypothetical protein
MATKTEIDIHLPEPHPEQLGAIQSTAKRKVVRALRSGKAAPTSEQISRFWARLAKPTSQQFWVWN